MAAIEPMKQFMIEKVEWLPPIVVGGMDLSVTNSVVMMFVAAGALSVMLWAAGRGALIPGRMQAVGETLFDLIEGTLVTPIIGHNGRPYIPFILTIFMLVLVMNLLGVVLSIGHIAGLDWTFTPTAQLAVTATLAGPTFVPVLGIGFGNNGLCFFHPFVPARVHLAHAHFNG